MRTDPSTDPGRAMRAGQAACAAVLAAALLAGCGDRPPDGWTGYAEAELVYVAPPVAGHYRPLGVLARRLIERGHSASAVRRGLMLAGDAFVTAPLAAPMRERFPGALSADMETTATARTAEALGVPFVALRAVSDLCGPAAGQQFHLEIDVVAETSARAVEALEAQGFDATNVEGGTSAWVESGHPLEA